MHLGKKLGGGSQGEVFEVSVQGRTYALKLVSSRYTNCRRFRISRI